MNRAVRNVNPVKPGRKSKISVILLSAGEASRMKSHGPRSLIKVADDTNLIKYQSDTIVSAIPNNEIILVCGCEADRVMNHAPASIICVENERFDSTNIVRSMAIGLRAATSDKILFIYGDLIFNHDTLKNAKFEESSVFIDKEDFFDKSGVGCTINEKNNVEHMLYGLPNLWAQMVFLTGRELSIFKNIVWNREKEKLFGFEVLNELIDRRGTLKAQSPKNMKVADIDCTKDLLNIKKIL